MGQRERENLSFEVEKLNIDNYTNICTIDFPHLIDFSLSLFLSLPSVRFLSFSRSQSFVCVCSTDSARTLFQPANWKCLPFIPRWCGSIRTDEIYIHSMASDDYLSLGSVVVCIWQVLARSE